RPEPQQLDQGPRDPLYQLAKFVASYLSERSPEAADARRALEVATARLREVELTAQSLGETVFQSMPRAARRSILDRLFSAARINVPFAAEPDDGLVNLVWDAHSVWLLTHGDGRLTCHGAFSTGRYELRARLAA